jgi:hypothetical protein
MRLIAISSRPRLSMAAWRARAWRLPWCARAPTPSGALPSDSAPPPPGPRRRPSSARKGGVGRVCECTDGRRENGENAPSEV